MKTNAARLANCRTRQAKQCSHCGKAFEGLKITRYCSESCRQKAKYLRGKAIVRDIPLSQTLGLSRPYDWSNPRMSEATFLLRVLEGADIVDIAKCVQAFGSRPMYSALARVSEPLTLAICRRKLNNVVCALEGENAQA
jgi:hypothetical protein